MSQILCCCWCYGYIRHWSRFICSVSINRTHGRWTHNSSESQWIILIVTLRYGTAVVSGSATTRHGC